jgi:ankyrin repeat protein
MVFGSSVINRAAFDIAKTLDMSNLDTSDETPLTVASENGDLQTVCKLMENKSLDVNLSHSIGRTPLYFACSKKLVNHPNIDVNREPKHKLYPPLLYCAVKNHIESVQELLKLPNIDVNVHESFGESPIYCANMDGHYRLVRELLKHDQIDVNKNRVLGGAPLHVASRRGHLQFVRELLQSEKMMLTKEMEMAIQPSAWQVYSTKLILFVST